MRRLSPLRVWGMIHMGSLNCLYARNIISCDWHLHILDLVPVNHDTALVYPQPPILYTTPLIYIHHLIVFHLSFGDAICFLCLFASQT